MFSKDFPTLGKMVTEKERDGSLETQTFWEEQIYLHSYQTTKLV